MKQRVQERRVLIDPYDSPLGHAPWARTPFALLMGLGLTTAGTLAILTGMGIIGDTSEQETPKWVAQAAGGTFLLVGLFLLANFIIGHWRKGQVSKRRRRFPGAPWFWDYDWQRQGTSDRRLASVLQVFGVTLSLGLFLAPFNWGAFSDGGRTWMIVCIGLFDLIWVGCLFGSAYRLAQYLKYGERFLRYHDFPFFLGASLRMTLEDLPRQISVLHLSLTFVEEVYEVQERGDGHGEKVNHYRLYQETRTYQKEELRSTTDLCIDWALPSPATGYVSTLSARPPRFWELEVKAETPGVDYQGKFLVPIYVRKGGEGLSAHSAPGGKGATTMNISGLG